jgi:hypothetical protein
MEQSLREDNVNEYVCFEKELWVSGLLNCQMAPDISMDKTWNHHCQLICQSVPLILFYCCRQTASVCCLVCKLLTTFACSYFTVTINWFGRYAIAIKVC